MGLTIIGPDQLAVQPNVPAALVEIKKNWNDPWLFTPELQVLRASGKVASSGIGEAELLYRYGTVKHPHESDFSSLVPPNFRGYWVRIIMGGGQGSQVVWVGRVAAEAREIYGAPQGPSGRQTWIAYEPLRLLQRIHVSRSVWLEDGGDPETDAMTLGWTPNMNGRDAGGMLVGNRSTEEVQGTYVFGGTNRWTRAQFLAYVLEHFVDELNDDSPGLSTGPGWVLGGQAALLHNISDIVTFSDVVSVADILRKLINPSIGLDFVVVPAEFSGSPAGGFEISVFPIISESVSVGGDALPRNNRLVSIRASQAKEVVRTNIVRTDDQSYGRIRVLGRRIVCAVTLGGAKTDYVEAVYPPGGVGPPEMIPTLVPLWSTQDQAAYEAGAGNFRADEDDESRRADKFETVYQAYGAPLNWGHAGGEAAPLLDSHGELKSAGDHAAGVGDPKRWQDTVRRTLHTLPFLEGADYTLGFEVLRAGVQNQTEFMPPQAWVYDESSNKFIPAHKARLGVSVLHNQLGLHLQASPNHTLGKNHFTGRTDDQPEYDYDRIVATVAFETDRRLEVQFNRDASAGWLPSDGELVVEDDTAELWYAASRTVYGVDSRGKLLTTPFITTLRNDIRHLGLVLAGLVARYMFPRARAEIFINGWQPWTLLLGAILETVEEKGNIQDIRSVITEVVYELEGQPRTVIRAGSA